MDQAAYRYSVEIHKHFQDKYNALSIEIVYVFRIG